MSKIKRKLSATTPHINNNSRAITEHLLSNLDSSQFVPYEDFSKLSNLVKHMRSKQESSHEQLRRIKAENNMLYQEIIDLRAQHDHQAKVISTEGKAQNVCLQGKKRSQLSIQGPSQLLSNPNSTININNLLPFTNSAVTTSILPQLTAGPSSLASIQFQPATISSQILAPVSEVEIQPSAILTRDEITSQMPLIRQPDMSDLNSENDDEPPILPQKRSRKLIIGPRQFLSRESLTKNSLESLKRSMQAYEADRFAPSPVQTRQMSEASSEKTDLTRMLSGDVNAVNVDLDEIRSLMQNNNSVYHLDNDMLDSIFRTPSELEHAADDPLIASSSVGLESPKFLPATPVPADLIEPTIEDTVSDNTSQGISLPWDNLEHPLSTAILEEGKNERKKTRKHVMGKKRTHAKVIR
ncbi:Heat shock factor protein 2 [Cichlidogyrus casuarinus]|uniref:Heat shock factor protein 2 n=1 Tax=Cichlidogyrus casuarinus TaxID=1844966 RepID=A0ABD2Q702_9PLAT